MAPLDSLEVRPLASMCLCVCLSLCSSVCVFPVLSRRRAGEVPGGHVSVLFLRLSARVCLSVN